MLGSNSSADHGPMKEPEARASETIPWLLFWDNAENPDGLAVLIGRPHWPPSSLSRTVSFQGNIATVHSLIGLYVSLLTRKRWALREMFFSMKILPLVLFVLLMILLILPFAFLASHSSKIGKNLEKIEKCINISELPAIVGPRFKLYTYQPVLGADLVNEGDEFGHNTFISIYILSRFPVEFLVVKHSENGRILAWRRENA